MIAASPWQHWHPMAGDTGGRAQTTGDQLRTKSPRNHHGKVNQEKDFFFLMFLALKHACMFTVYSSVMVQICLKIDMTWPVCCDDFLMNSFLLSIVKLCPCGPYPGYRSEQTKAVPEDMAERREVIDGNFGSFTTWVFWNGMLKVWST